LLAKDNHHHSIAWNNAGQGWPNHVVVSCAARNRTHIPSRGLRKPANPAAGGLWKRQFFLKETVFPALYFPELRFTY
jgi:hypothetical protein